MIFTENTLEIRGLCFGYKNNIQILNGINLTVPKGGIYGLLGSSGCGKTTLLRCALGRLQPKRGSIKLFGHRPGTKESRVPGPGVGYMPQEIALYDDFSIDETLIYFGRLFGIKANIVNQRIDFLMDLLQLPDKTRIISKLSGGQKRRVSISTALLHNPPFLILDEPTVGVDLILREAIWKHLELLCVNGLTVIVTTHYIEEAKNTLRVGFMRSGRLLAEDSPMELLRLHGLNTLESVFLKLSQFDDRLIANSSATNLNAIREEVNEINDEFIDNKTGIVLKVIKPEEIENRATNRDIVDHIPDNHPNGHTANTKTAQAMRRYSRKQSIANGLIQLRQEMIITDTNFFYRLFALTLKNFKQMSRNLPLLLFFVLLPSVEISLLITCIGRDINQIPVAVFNPEKSFPLSEMFLDSIDKNRINIIRYKTLDLAVEAVHRSDAWAVIYFRPRFSENFYTRLLSSNPSEETIDLGSIYLRLDMSNQVIGSQIQKYISEAFDTFIDEVKDKFETKSLDKVKPMVRTGPPVYGTKDASFGSFVAPGALIVVAYFATTVVTCHLLIKERTDGLVERSLVAGVKPLEFVLSHIILQLFLLTLQVGLKLFIAFFIFSIPNFGSFFWASTLTFLQGMCGLMFGLMLSAICPDEIYATTLCIGAFFPTVIVGGILWPLESMPIGLRYISQTLPSTLAIDSLRAILMRGWGVGHIHVLLGFVVTLLWMSFFLINALVFFIKKL